jgi:hypothetical protein
LFAVQKAGIDEHHVPAAARASGNQRLVFRRGPKFAVMTRGERLSCDRHCRPSFDLPFGVEPTVKLRFWKSCKQLFPKPVIGKDLALASLKFLSPTILVEQARDNRFSLR